MREKKTRRHIYAAPIVHPYHCAYMSINRPVHGHTAPLILCSMTDKHADENREPCREPRPRRALLNIKRRMLNRSPDPDRYCALLAAVPRHY